MFEPPYQPDFYRNPALSLPYFYMFDQLMVIDLIDDVRKVLKLRRMAGIDQCMMWSAHEFFKIIHQDLSARLSSASNGSSRIRISGFSMKAWIRRIFCFMPNEYFPYFL